MLAVEIFRLPHPLPRTIVVGVFILLCTVVGGSL